MDNKSLEDILEEISSEKAAPITDEPAELIFEIETESVQSQDKEIGLIFDDSEEEPEPTISNVTFETVEKEEEKPIELSVPERFEINEKYDTKPIVEEAPRIRATYVPTFTGVSDSYRMVNDARPKTGVKKQEKNDATSEFEGDIDPTAEIDENVEIKTATPVKSTSDEKNNTESVSTVFKFKENELPPEEPKQLSAEEPIIDENVGKTEEMPEDGACLEESETEFIDPDAMFPAIPVDSGGISASISERMVLIDPPSDVGNKTDSAKSGKGSVYTSYAQRDAIKDKYLDKIMSVRVRFIASAAIALLLFVIEIISAAGVNIPQHLNIVGIPGAMALIDLQFVICLFLISLPETLNAILMLFKKQPLSALYLPISFITMIVYTIVAVIVTPEKYPVFGILFAIASLVAIGGTHYKTSADFTAFKLISVNGEKNIIDNRYTRTLERENAALDGATAEHKSKIARLFRTVFVSDFFAGVEKGTENAGNVLIMLGVSFGAALVTGGVAYFIPGGFMSAFSAFAMVLMTAFPVMALTAEKQPYYHAAREAELESSAIIGEAAMLDFSGIDVVAFDDTEVFGADDVSVQRIMLYGKNENLPKALRQMSALFVNVGGPLDLLFSNSLDRKCAPANAVEVFENGVTGELDGVPVAGGSLKFMRDAGIFIPDYDGGIEPQSDSVRIMYAAENGSVYAKFYIRYSFSEDFSMLLPMLDDEKIKVLVYTRDPGINCELMKTLTAGSDKIRVIRRNTPHSHDNPLYNKVSASAVTLGDKANAISAILTAKKYASLEARFSVSEKIALAVGGVLAAILSIGGMFIVPPVVLALWQAAWCGVLHVISLKTFRRKNQKDESE